MLSHNKIIKSAETKIHIIHFNFKKLTLNFIHVSVQKILEQISCYYSLIANYI